MCYTENYSYALIFEYKNIKSPLKYLKIQKTVLEQQ